MQKPNFSVAEAFAAGVDLIERAFKSVLIWALAMFLLALVPACVAFVVQGGHFIVPDGGFKLSGVTGLNSGLVTDERRQILGADLAYWLLGAIWAVVGAAVIYAAIYRTTWARSPAVGRPSPRRGGRMAVAGHGGAGARPRHRDPGRLDAALVLALVAAILGPPFSGSGARGRRAVVVAAALWVVLRLCLCQAMTVAENRFRFFEKSWGLTKGRSWRLFWTFSLVLALIIGLEVLYLGMVVIEIVDLRRHHREPEDRPARADPRFRRSDRPALAGLRLAAGRPAEALLVAPLASAYRGLSQSS